MDIDVAVRPTGAVSVQLPLDNCSIFRPCNLRFQSYAHGQAHSLKLWFDATEESLTALREMISAAQALEKAITGVGAPTGTEVKS